MPQENVTQPVLLMRVTSAIHAKDFQNGNMFMNALQTFKDIEDKGNEMTQDYLEGMKHVVQANEFDFVADSSGTPVLSTEHMIGGIHRPDKEAQFQKIICLFELKLDSDKQDIQPIDQRILDFGDTFIMITDFKEFCRRFEVAIRNSSDIEPPVYFHNIKYYDPMSYTGGLNVFYKRESYSWQNEWRIALKLKEKNTCPYTLNIGDLSDITIIGNTKQLLETMYLAIDEDGVKLNFENDWNIK